MLARSYTAIALTTATLAIGYGNVSEWVRGGPDSEKFKILLVLPESIAFSRALARGAESASHELNFELTLQQPTDGSLEATTTAADAVLLGLERIAPLPPFIEELGADVNFLTCGPVESPRLGWGHIGASNFGIGRGCASYLVQLCPDGGTVIVLVDDQNDKETFYRLDGFRWQARRSRASTPLELFVCEDDHGNGETSITNARSALRAHPQAICVVDLSRRLKESVVVKLCELMARGDAKLILFEQSDAALAGVESGRVQCVIADDPFALGRCAVRLLAEFRNAGELGLPAPGRALVNCPSIIVNARNVSKYRKHQGPGWTCAASADIRL